MSRRSRVTAPDLVRTIIDTGTRVLTAEHGVSRSAALAATEAVARAICDAYGKQDVYIPADMGWALTERDLQIWAAYGRPGPDGERPYSGARVQALGREWDLSAQQVYAIVRAVRRREIAERQGVLPGIDPAPLDD